MKPKPLTTLLICILILAACKRTDNGDWPDERMQSWFSYYDIASKDFKEESKHDIPYRVSSEFTLSDDDIYLPLYIFNNDSTFAIDIDSYHLVLDKLDDGTLYSPGREVDWEVGLIDLRKNVRKRILFCGTPCIFEEAAFHPNGNIVVAGFIENDKGYLPAMWSVDPEQYTVSLSIASELFNANEIHYISRKRLEHVRFWFEDYELPDQLDIPL